MTTYCRNQSAELFAWFQPKVGFSECMTSAIYATLVFFIFCLCFIQFLYRCSSINGDKNSVKPSACRRMISIILHILISFNVTGAFVEVLVKIYTDAFAYSFLTDLIAQILIWAASGLYLAVESRCNSFGMTSSISHFLLVFALWIINFIKEVILLIDIIFYQGEFQVRESKAHIWLLRFAFEAFIVVFGCIYWLIVERSEYTSLPERKASKKLLGSNLGFLIPYIWPVGRPMLQLRVVVCLSFLLLGRVAVLFVPIIYKKIIESLTENNSKFPLALISAYVLAYFSAGGGVNAGLVINIRNFIWIPVHQYTSKLSMTTLFGHLHDLSLQWHLSRKTGEVLSIIDRGNQSVTQLLSFFLFNILPMILDILIAVCYFFFAFNIWFAIVVLGCMSLYSYATIFVSEWRAKYRRASNQAENEIKGKAVDSLLNFETVKYHSAEKFELERYGNAIEQYQKHDFNTQASFVFLNLAQSTVINMGLLAGCMLCAYYVTDNRHVYTVGDYVLFTTYIIQLYGPLNSLGTYYRLAQQYLIDMENMLSLMAEVPDVDDKVDAHNLQISKGHVKFENVCFSYNGKRKILQNLSFEIQPGGTLAIVGPSGVGKSTIVRLLFRFYNITSGRIIIDGQDITEVKQNSLRKQIGVVPQDTILFNDTILYNIGYASETSTKEDVLNAAMAAELHDSIKNFSNGYETVVGERGLKLSGGEKQRVAIARTLLKEPQIVVLDEATSSLDTKTERAIQNSLDRICSTRTTIIIAHRLSTVVSADEILVLKEGSVHERGTHSELLENQDLYYEMWMRQQEASE